MSLPLEVLQQYDPKELEIEADQFKEAVYQQAVEMRDFLVGRFGDFRPRLAAVLGSGIGGLAQNSAFQELGSIPYEEVPYMAKPQTLGHEGRLYWGHIEGLPVMLFSGRVQVTDFTGWNITPSRAARLATLPLTVAKGLGVEAVILTSAAGYVDDNVNRVMSFFLRGRKVKVGDVVVVADYTNFIPLTSPTLAPYDERLSMPFVGKGNTVDPELYSYVKGSLGGRCHVGRYALTPSARNYEGAFDLTRTMAPEMLVLQNPKSLTVVGMSMPPEFDALIMHNDPPADHYGFDRPVRILGMSVITNKIPPARLSTEQTIFTRFDPNPAKHEEVIQAGKEAEAHLMPAFIEMCRQLNAEEVSQG